MINYLIKVGFRIFIIFVVIALIKMLIPDDYIVSIENAMRYSMAFWLPQFITYDIAIYFATLFNAFLAFLFLYNILKP